MARGWLHTVWAEGQWVNLVEESGPMTKHEERKEAVEFGRQVARRLRTVHVVHSMSGAVRESNDYNADAADEPPGSGGLPYPE